MLVGDKLVSTMCSYMYMNSILPCVCLCQVFKQSPNGWWEGEVQSRGKKRSVGWFPANRVELLPQRQSRNSSISSTSSVPSTPASVMGVGVRRLSRARSVSNRLVSWGLEGGG